MRREICPQSISSREKCISGSRARLKFDASSISMLRVFFHFVRRKRHRKKTDKLARQTRKRRSTSSKRRVSQGRIGDSQQLPRRKKRILSNMQILKEYAHTHTLTTTCRVSFLISFFANRNIRKQNRGNLEFK